MSQFIINQLRAGSPDKANLWHYPFYTFTKLNHRNLVDYTNKELVEGEYYLPADEGDIIHANKKIDKKYHPYILLPQTKDGLIINYDEFVPKNAKVYKDLEKNTGIIYPKSKIMSVTTLRRDGNSITKGVLKTTSGSGSRGVYVIDEDRLHLGNKVVAKMTDNDIESLINYAKSQKAQIILQDLIPGNLEKVNIDFIIRNGKLLGYKWTVMNQSQQFTNWDNGYILVNKYTDGLMKKLTKYLVSLGVHNAIMNFEAFSDNKATTWMVEFNWRYSNSMFEFEAFNIDPIYHYLTNTSFKIPVGKHYFTRHWQCSLNENLGI